jgi:platelet-activating factor acetylhydrolase IB subunit alpha
MVLTDKAKAELLCSVVDFLQSNGLGKAAAALVEEGKVDIAGVKAAAGLLEKKWTSVLRLQKKVMQLEEENKQLKVMGRSLRMVKKK